MIGFAEESFATANVLKEGRLQLLDGNFAAQLDVLPTKDGGRFRVAQERQPFILRSLLHCRRLALRRRVQVIRKSDGCRIGAEVVISRLN